MRAYPVSHWFLLWIFMLAGCDPSGSFVDSGSFVKIDARLGSSAIQSLQGLLFLNGQLADQRLSIPVLVPPEARQQQASGDFSFILQLPIGAEGELRVMLAAFDESGCFVATGESTIAVSESVTSQQVPIDLAEINSFYPYDALRSMNLLKGCQDPEKIPRLEFIELSGFGVSYPPLALMLPATLILDGWGMLPGSTFTMNSLPAEVVSWISSTRVEVRVPSGGTLLAPVSISVQNPDGTTDTRADLFPPLPPPPMM